MGATDEKTSRTKPEGMDDISRLARRRLEGCQHAKEHIEKAASIMGSMPRGEVVWSKLDAAYGETHRYFTAILDKEDFSDIPFRAIFPRCVREQVIL